MKNQISNRKSKIIHLIAACVILAAFGPPAAAPSRADSGGGPPNPVNYTFIASGVCDFDVQVTVTGREGVVFLPSGGLIVTAPTTFGTFTNPSDPTKSVTLNITGVFHISFDQNGNTIYMLTGRNALADPSVGLLLLLVGDFTFVLDSNGNPIGGLTGNGQITSICDMID